MRALIVLSIMTVTQGNSNRRWFNDLRNDLQPTNGLQHGQRSYPAAYMLPVDFRNYKVEGYGYPVLDLKPPIDLLEGDMFQPRTFEEARNLLSKVPIRNVQLVKTGTKQEEQTLTDEGSEESGSNENTRDKKSGKLLDFANILERNVQRLQPPPAVLARPPTRNSNYQVPQTVDKVMEQQKSEYFAKNTYELRSQNKQDKENWTTCKEFGKGASFHPKDIINFNWVPFYIWSNWPMVRSIVHRFTVPTKKLVSKYVTELSPYLKKSLVDWEQPKLLLREVREMLLVAKDRKGLFVAIPYQEIPDSLRHTNFQLPLYHIKIKIEDPYLALMYCDDEHALIMAVEGNVPDSLNDKIDEANTLGFHGRGFPVTRDMEKEMLREKAQRELTLEEENRKIIHIPAEKGVDIPKYYK